MTRLRRFAASAGHTRASVATLAVLAFQALVHAHAGPPYPIVTDAVRGPYTISIWTDPDATDDGSPGGQFWIVIGPSANGSVIPADTRATVSAPGAGAAQASPVRGDVGNQFAAVVMDHEGPYSVRVDITGPLGQAVIDTMVDATYDLRPPPYMLVWYLVPFLLVGFLWGRLLLRRRSAGRGLSDRVHVP